MLVGVMTVAFLSEHRNNTSPSLIERVWQIPELGIRYFIPYSLFANPLLQCSYLLSLLRYFSEFCNTLPLFAIRYSLLPLTSVIDFFP
jgi:hypothetical protein